MWMGLAIECAIWYYDAGCWCVRAPTGEKEREIYLSISSLYVRFLMPMGMMVSLTAAVLQQTHKYICIAPDRCRSGSVYRRTSIRIPPDWLSFKPINTIQQNPHSIGNEFHFRKRKVTLVLCWQCAASMWKSLITRTHNFYWLLPWSTAHSSRVRLLTLSLLFVTHNFHFRLTKGQETCNLLPTLHVNNFFQGSASYWLVSVSIELFKVALAKSLSRCHRSGFPFFSLSRPTLK